MVSVSNLFSGVLMHRFARVAAVLSIGVALSIPSRFCPGDDDPNAESDVKEASLSTTVGIQFESDFSSSTGASLTTTDGQNPLTAGDLEGMYSAFGSVPSDQSRVLTLRVTEDDGVAGPDEKPGVLRLQFVEVPLRTRHSGFLLYGDQDHGRMRMPGWTLGEVTMSDLRRTFIEFKFRADNPEDSTTFGQMYSFRFEPQHPDSYKLRAEFGALIATPRWRTFRRPIASAKNLEEFLRGVNEEDPPNFKLVWSQSGPIQRYTPGDSLLIDDLKIVIE